MRLSPFFPPERNGIERFDYDGSCRKYQEIVAIEQCLEELPYPHYISPEFVTDFPAVHP
jgi:hypothetical protein